MWRMPLEASYRKHLDSMIADIKNWSAKPGGGITAALFLQEFVTTDKARYCLPQSWSMMQSKSPGNAVIDRAALMVPLHRRSHGHT